jgi:RHS repeat-associated protein
VPALLTVVAYTLLVAAISIAFVVWHRGGSFRGRYKIAQRLTVRATSRLLIVVLIITLFPFAAASPASAADLAHTPPAGWSTGAGNPGLAMPANVTDADDSTQGNIGVDPGQGCSPVGGFVECSVAFNYARSSGVTSFQINSIRMKFAYCVSGWPTFATCTNSNTGVSVAQVEVLCAVNFVNVSVLLLTTGWNGISEIPQTNFTTPCTLDSTVSGSASLAVVMRINRDTCLCGSSVWWSVELHDDTAPPPAAGPEQLGDYTGAVFSKDPVNIATGNFLHHANDLALPGRLLGLSFTRWYNSADPTTGPLGPAWTHSYNWKLTDLGASVSVRRGDGRVDTFTRNPDLSYAAPVGVFDTLVKNGDTTYTLTLPNQVAYAFSSAGALTRISEPAGNQMNLSYTSGNLTTITDTVGRAIALSYDGSNRLTQLQDPLGRKVTYTYDGSGRLATMTDKIGNATGQNPALHRWTYGYDGTTPHLTTITDPDGRVGVTNTYDAQGRVYQQRDGLSALTTFAYSAGQTVLTDPRSHATTYTFDSRFREVSESDVVGGNTYTLSYTYDAAGNRSSVTDRNGKRTDFSFDARGNVLTKTDPQIGSNPRYLTQFQYDSKNNLTQITDARSFVSTMTYSSTSNALLSLSQQIDTVPTYAVTKWEYSDSANPGLPTKIISPRGNTTGTPNYTYSQSLAYDSSGNLVQRIDADAAKTTFGYDGVGRQTSLVDPDGYASGGVPADHTWTAVYDENDRVTSVTDPLAHSSASAYDGAGNRTSATDPNANVTSYAYDLSSRLLNTTQKPDPAGQPTLIYTTSVLHDGNGNITRVTQANGVVTDYAFDALNRLTSMSTHPDGSTTLTTSYALDGNGLPLTRTAGDGVVVTYAYDAMSRLTSVSASGLTTINYAYDELSRRTQMVDGTGTTTYQYDGLSRLTQVAAPNGTVTYAYDRDGNRTTLGYPGAQNVTYAYSPGGRLASATDWASRASSYTYKASGLVATATYPDTMQATYAFDRAQRLTALTNKVGATTISGHGYILDAAGNRTTLDEFVSGITTPGGNDHFTYSYDGLNRLKTVTGPVAESFTLDAASNLASRTGPTATYSYDTANRLLSDGAQSFTWNAADRLAQRGRDTFTFDALGRLTASQIVDDATLSGATWSTTDVPNSSAASLSFNGTGAYAEAPHSPVLNITGDWTVEAWFKDATSGGYNHGDTFMLMKGDSNVDGEAPYFLKIDHKLLSAGVRTNWTSYRVTYDLFAGGVSANAWHHAAATFVASTRQITLYVDGVQKSQGTVAASSATGNARPVSIGRNGTTGAYWNGKLDDVRIWNVVRTSTQISTSYQSELTSSPTGLVANWKLDDASGTVAADLGVARSYSYNGDGLLKSRSEAGATTQLLWDVGAAPAQLLVSGADRLVNGLSPLYIVRGDGTTRTLSLDGLGSVRAEVSDAGATLSSFRYAVYGKLVSKPVTPTLLGYAGELGETSGLNYLRARWYDPSTGRFLSRDPRLGSALVPGSLSGFNYADARPTFFTDPRGLDPDANPSHGRTLTTIAYFPIVPENDLDRLLRFLYAIGQSVGSDYVALQGNVRGPALWGPGMGLTLDRYGNVYWTPISLAAGIPGAGVSVMLGWLLQASTPSERDLVSFLEGPTFSGGTALGFGVNVVTSPSATGTRIALESGLGTLSAGVVGGTSFRVLKAQLYW